MPDLPGPEQEEFRKFYPGTKKDEEFCSEDAAGVGNSTFSIRVQRIITEKVELREKLKRRYDWTVLMNLILKELQGFYDSPELFDTGLLEHRITHQVSQWYRSFSGFGLAYLLLGKLDLMIRYFSMVVLRHGGKEFKKVCEIDPECAFKALFSEGFYFYSFWKEHIENDIRVDSCNLLRSSIGTNNFTKILRIPFFSNFDTRVDVEFSIERIQPPMSLVDLTARFIASPMAEKLKSRQNLHSRPFMLGTRVKGALPFTLLSVIRNKVKDLNWALYKVKNRDQCKYESEDIVESTLPEFLFS